MDIAIVLDIGIIMLLIPFIYQDFKYRGIDRYWFALLFLVVCIKNIVFQVNADFWTHSAINLSFLFVQYALLKVYFFLKGSSKIVDVKIGKGDLLFYPIIALLFNPINFFYFYLFSLIFILLVYLFRKSKQNIPLAGHTAVFLICLFIANELTVHDLFLQNEYLTQFFP